MTKQKHSLDQVFEVMSEREFQRSLFVIALNLDTTALSPEEQNSIMTNLACLYDSTEKIREEQDHPLTKEEIEEKLAELAGSC